MITEKFINELIICPKRAIGADRKRMISVNRSLRNKASLISVDGNYTYSLFLRQSEDFMEDFSVGLIWTNASKHIGINKEIILIRYQGPHDSGKPLGEDVHHDYHIHQISVEDVNERRYLRPGNKEISHDFSSFLGALFSLTSYCGIIDLDKYIDYSQFNAPLPGQMDLFNQ